jgi:hypothetical protein
VSRLTVTLSDFINYFAPLSHGERTPVTQEQVWSGLRGHRCLARAARKRISERQISKDAQVEQDELLTRNMGGKYESMSEDGPSGSPYETLAKHDQSEMKRDNWSVRHLSSAIARYPLHSYPHTHF